MFRFYTSPKITVTASGAVHQGYLAKIAGDMIMAECTADTDIAVGVFQTTRADGEDVDVMLFAIPYAIKASAGITAADEIAPHTDSTGKTADTGDKVCAFALSTVAGAGEYVIALPVTPYTK